METTTPVAKKKGRPYKKVEKNYKVTIQLGDKVYVGRGKSSLEALKNLEKPVKITSKVFFKITDGEREAESMFMPFKAKRLFFPLAQTYLAEQFEHLMK